ncbi:phosphotransferase [Paenibacillus gansuensis]|uniref:Phosphotransferase n=1 Tax=Paenibacillus gansuensis TaxID=306542 RepID=A0ABW5PDZ7_9BACL
MAADPAITEKLIRRKWRKLGLSADFHGFGGDVALAGTRMQCLKDSYKTSIWRLKIRAGNTKHTVILKVFKSYSRKKRPGNITELNMYRKARPLLKGAMPKIYSTHRKVNGDDRWVFMEYIRQLEGNIDYTPEQFSRIIPALAKMHARTYEDKFNKQLDTFVPWLPRYNSRTMGRNRKELQKSTLLYLDEAMKRPDLREVLSPSYKKLRRILRKGPDYFPEVVEAGQSIIHCDLSARNIGCNNVKDAVWDIKLLDWESAKYAPCWFDVIHLAGIYLGYRQEYAKQEEAIIRKCALHYAKEMKKHGITFKTDPVKLYKMAYLQLILERFLYHQLSWEIHGRKEGKLLRYFLRKIEEWGPELGL